MYTQAGMSFQKGLFNLARHHDHGNIAGFGAFPECFEEDKPLCLGYFNVGDNEIGLFGNCHGKAGLTVLGVDNVDTALGQQVVYVGLIEEVILNYEELQL